MTQSVHTIIVLSAIASIVHEYIRDRSKSQVKLEIRQLRKFGERNLGRHSTQICSRKEVGLQFSIQAQKPVDLTQYSMFGTNTALAAIRVNSRRY